MSALSCCVTCGMTFQAWPRCSAVLRRMLLIGLRSTSPHLVKSGSARRRGRGAAAPPPASAVLHECLHVLDADPPAGPLPATRRMSTPSSRASRRTDGAAGAAGARRARLSAAAAAAGCARAPRLMSTTSPRGSAAARLVGSASPSARSSPRLRRRLVFALVLRSGVAAALSAALFRRAGRLRLRAVGRFLRGGGLGGRRRLRGLRPPLSAPSSPAGFCRLRRGAVVERQHDLADLDLVARA